MGIDVASGNLQVNNVFTYDPVHDQTSYTGRSQVYSSIAERRGWTREQLGTEIAVRKNLLDEMHNQGIRDYISVASIFHNYHINRAEVLAHIADLRQVL